MERVKSRVAVVREVSTATGCGYNLARDLLVLAGWDPMLVYDACDAVSGIESVKAFIIDARLSKLEGK